MSSAAPTPLPPGRLYIGGEWSGAASGRTYPTENPATEEVLTEVAEADLADVNRAVVAARAALAGPWREVSPRQRGQLLWRLADLVDLLLEAEMQCKTTGLPDEAILRRTALRIAQGARSLARAPARR